MNKVSVVMAGRNSNPAFLKEAIDSVLNQTYKDFEFIFVDDGSDNPMEPVVRSISNDVRIKVLRIEPSGLGAALNYGINKAKGEYIARLDDDDVMLSARLEKQVGFLEANVGVSCVGTWFYDKVARKCYPHRKYPLNHEDIVSDLVSMRWGMAHTTVLYRKSSFDAIGGYRIPGGGQDLDLFLQLGTVGELANIGEFLTCYRMSLSGLGSVNPKKRDAYIFALDDVVKRNLYPTLTEKAQVSIESLRQAIHKKPRAKYFRLLMALRVKLLGKIIE